MIQMGKPIRSKIVGVTATSNGGIARQDIITKYCRAGMPLMLIREPNNRYDVNAIGVWITVRVLIFLKTRLQIGYIRSELAESLADYLDNGRRVNARILQLTGNPEFDENVGVNIEIIPE
jgi:hypothetical protein